MTRVATTQEGSASVAGMMLADFPEALADWSARRNGSLDPATVPAGSSARVWWRCQAGHEWMSRVGDHRRSVARGRRCPVCSGRRLVPGVNDLATAHPALASEWDREANDDLTARDVTIASSRRVGWRCKHGHTWTAPIARRLTRGCPVCAGKLVVAGVNDLATVRPDMGAQWHPTRNAGVGAHEVTAGSSRRVWWRCSLGHEWAAAPKDRARRMPASCPTCSGRTVLAGFNDLATTHPSFAAQWHPTANGEMTPHDVSAGSNAVVWWQGSCGHRWRSSVKSRISQDAGCNVCASKVIQAGFNDLASAAPDLAARWHPTRNGDLTPQQVGRASMLKVWWLESCGHEFDAPIGNRYQGAGCPVCAGKRRLVGFNDLATVRPDLAAQWHPSLNPHLQPHEVTTGQERVVWWQGECGHHWQATVQARTRGSGCAICAGKVVVAGVNDLATAAPQTAAMWHPTRNASLTPRDVTRRSGRTVWWLCPKGHEWSSPVHDRSEDTGCPRCIRWGESQIEIDLRTQLRALGEHTAESGSLPVAWGRASYARCDIVLPERHCVVEYDGSWWHRDKAASDASKTRALLNAGWTVLRVREHPLPGLSVKHPRYLELVHHFQTSTPRDLARRVQALLERG